MTTKIQKWGNSLAVRLPKKVAGRLGLREGSRVEIGGAAEEIVIIKFNSQNNKIRKADWRKFVIPTDKKKEQVSVNIDKILYGDKG